MLLMAQTQNHTMFPLPSLLSIFTLAAPFLLLNPQVRMKYIGASLVKVLQNTLVVGNVGVGKTMIIQSLLDGLPADRSHMVINFSAQTSSNSLQVGIHTSCELSCELSYGFTYTHNSPSDVLILQTSNLTVSRL